MANVVKRGVVTVEDVEDKYDTAGASERVRHEDEPNGDEGYERTVPEDEDRDKVDTAYKWSR